MGQKRHRLYGSLSPIDSKKMKKKEFVITDFMDLHAKRGGILNCLKSCIRQFWHVCLPRNLPRHVCRKGIYYVLPISDLVSKRIVLKGYMEPDSVLYFFNAARQGTADVLLDIGSNIGYYSFLATKTGDFSEIHAIEPHPEIYRLLTDHIERNAFNNMIMPHNFAASDQNREMFIDTKAWSGATVSANKRQATIAIKATTLDSVFDFVGRRIAIKIDVEGHETQALVGMKNLLANNAVLLQVEIWGKSPNSLNYLSDSALRCIYRIKDNFYFVNDKWSENH
ncbi:methyltransferase, FkbM family domain protein [uncultured Candidatus Thioglobus sp.]|nr:methyltransferase, FkbM family domain protein [uncultured Candidatus Thioglobus sp.]